ncbi:MAG: hypothetical protein AWU58_1650 [Methanohalophilus sp. T328-1]|nr:MAG: hypothetical protein AWU58_1650 [Methanohalophilus sp. T328-1]
MKIKIVSSSLIFLIIIKLKNKVDKENIGGKELVYRFCLY